MKLLNFESKSLVVDWISFNIQDLPDSGIIAFGLSKYFILYLIIEDKFILSIMTSLKNF